MRSILETLAHKEMGLCAIEEKRRSHYNDIIEISDSCQKALMDSLDGDNRELFESFVAMQPQIVDAVALDRFVYGYRLGVMIMAEVYNGQKA